MEMPEHIWFLISRSLSGEATAQEREQLKDALQDQPGLMQQYDMLQQVWQMRPGMQEEKEEKGKINRILQLSAAEQGANLEGQPVVHLSRPGSIRKIFKWSALAAAVSAGVWLSIELFESNRKPSNEIVAQNGSKTRTILPDGSTVWLNAGSKIIYEPSFSGPFREVTLQGEAFFEVVRQPEHPFIVHAGDLNITVLGTAFNVKSYLEDKTIETTLIRGLVQITRKNDSTGMPVYLHPNQKIVLPASIEEEKPATSIRANPFIEPHPTNQITNLDTALKENERIETAWIYNRLEFRGDSFEELSRKLQRWYNVNIHFEDEAVKQLTFNGSLENETVEEAFHALKAAVPFDFTIHNNEIFIRSAKPVAAVAK